MTIRNDGIIVRQLFLLIEKERYDSKLEKLLKETVESDYYSDYIDERVLSLSFKNGVQVTISKHLDYNNIHISGPSFYALDEDGTTKLSDDRVLWYLNNIAQYKYGN